MEISSNKQQPSELQYDRIIFKSTERFWVQKIMLCEECLTTVVSATEFENKTHAGQKCHFFCRFLVRSIKEKNNKCYR